MTKLVWVNNTKPASRLLVPVRGASEDLARPRFKNGVGIGVIGPGKINTLALAYSRLKNGRFCDAGRSPMYGHRDLFPHLH